MIISWPGALPAGQTFAGLSISLDIVPTALATEYPEITERLAARFDDWQSQIYAIIEKPSANPNK